jgi:hypothetical protein
MKTLIAALVLTAATLGLAGPVLAQTGGGIPSPIIPPQPIPVICQRIGTLVVCTGGGT